MSTKDQKVTICLWECTESATPGEFCKLRPLDSPLQSQTPTQESGHTPRSNRWLRFRNPYKEYFAEFLGVMILMIFVNGTNCQVVLSNRKDIVSFPAGDFQSINFGTAVGAAMGVWIAGGISGGHINPAVTLALAVWRGFPWRKVPGYIFAQLMGGVAGAALIYANYFHGIDLFENGVGIRTLKTAGLFATYAQPYMTNVSCFFSEFLGTAVMLICVMAFGDRRNGPPPAGLAPLAIFFLLLGLGCALGVETGYALNPARDLGPRILTSTVGYGSAVYSYRSQYWLWCTVLGPVLGAQAGCMVYDLFLYDGEDSIVNKQAPRSPSEEKTSETCA